MQDRTNSQRRRLLKMVAVAPLAVSLDLHSMGNANPDETFINCVAEALIPGAGVTRPGAELLTLLPVGWLGVEYSAIQAVHHALDGRGQQAYVLSSPEQQQLYLSAFDAECYDTPAMAVSKDWFTLKSALLSLFFSSEQGASHTLSYHPVPAHWRPDIPIKQATPAMYNDWLAVWFT